MEITRKNRFYIFIPYTPPPNDVIEVLNILYIFHTDDLKKKKKKCKAPISSILVFGAMSLLVTV